MSNKPFKMLQKRKILTSVMGELIDSLSHASAFYPVSKETHAQQGNFHVQTEDNSLEDKASSLEQAMDWIDSLQGKSTPQLTPSISAQSPWFGTAEKRLTGLSSLTLFTPIDAKTLAEHNHPLGMQHYWLVMNKQSEVFAEQLQRRVDRLIGVRAKVDEWETIFPEDE